MRSLGLLVDGPAVWGRAIPGRGPGLFVIELPAAPDEAPIDTVAVRRWLERVPKLTLDGERPTVPELMRRLAEFWLPGEPILFVGRSARSIGQRLAAMYATTLGDAKPTAAGHWLKTLSTLSDLRVWGAETDAHEEYEDAILTEVAARNAGAPRSPVLPFANLSAPGGPPREHGLVDSLLTADAADDSERSRKSAAAAKAKAARRPAATVRARKPVVRDAAPRPVAAPTYVSREGLDQITAELEDLRSNVRPQVIARVKAARELGDLRENADYEYARKEQSFVEGRIQTLEHMLRTGVVIERQVEADVIHLGSTVEVETDGELQIYVIVGSTEARPSAGRLSNESPVGRALLGARAGDDVTVALPNGSVTYHVVAVS